MLRPCSKHNVLNSTVCHQRFSHLGIFFSVLVNIYVRRPKYSLFVFQVSSMCSHTPQRRARAVTSPVERALVIQPVNFDPDETLSGQRR